MDEEIGMHTERPPTTSTTCSRTALGSLLGRSITGTPESVAGSLVRKWPAGTGAAEILRRIDAVTVDDVGQLAADTCTPATRR
ncbi:MAG TPA: hypothetical protein VGD71_26265 [Kribbella sp.]